MVIIILKVIHNRGFSITTFKVKEEKERIFVYMEDKLIKWLKSKKGLLKIRAIEKELGMAQGSLNKYLLEKEELADHWLPKIREWVKNFKKG